MKKLLLAAVALVASGCASESQMKEPQHATQACSALGDPAKAAAPFYEPGNVYEARPIHRTVSRTRAFENRQLAGSELHMHATAGMTAEYLQRALTCQASAASASRPNDPLRPNGRIDEIGVRSTGAGFAIAVTSNDATTAKEIWQRSQVLASSEPTVEVRQVD